MRRLLAAVAATAAIAGFAPSAAATHKPVIYVQNLSTEVSNREVKRDLPAIQAALDHDFAPIWHTPARLVFLGHKPAPKGAEVIQLVNFPDCWFCAGYHSFADGQISAVIGVDPSLDPHWTSVFTHELWEMLADPYADDALKLARTVTLPDGTEYLVETADPVEMQSYVRLTRARKPVYISDFVTPAWFDPTSTSGWDFMNAVTHPLQILKGGYQTLKYPGGDWTSINNFDQAVSDGER